MAPINPYRNLTLEQHGPVIVLTLRKPPENRINVAFAQEIIRALRDAEAQLRKNGERDGGALITRGSDAKFWCTGLDLDESDSNPHANGEGFYPLLATILDFPFPTVALLTGHTFGGACPLALSHDYRVMNSKRGWLSMPPVNLGLHFDGIGTLPRLKLAPKIARKMLLEAHRWTATEALADGVVDAIAEPEKMFDVALDLAKTWAPKGRMGVYSLLRNELYGEAAIAFRKISYVHGRPTSRPAKAKI
jgi:enoyl-CoA hydratase/carnithine racemase